jgi:hypothetical protein
MVMDDENSIGQTLVTLGDEVDYRIGRDSDEVLVQACEGDVCSILENKEYCFNGFLEEGCKDIPPLDITGNG